jgi:hypothetical protein
MNSGLSANLVMPGRVPGIHVFASLEQENSLEQEKTWMAGTSPAMTNRDPFQAPRRHLRILAAFSIRL